MSTLKGVILAAGKGSRMAKDGARWSKPMVPLGDRPMIGRLIDQMFRCGAEAVHISVNPDMHDLTDYLNDRAASDSRIVVRPIRTDNSYESLREATRGIEGRFIASTVDAVVSDPEMAEMFDVAPGLAENEGMMGLMTNVHDETPLWASVTADGLIEDYSWNSEPFACGEIASAGIYGLDGYAMRLLAESKIYPESLSHSQQLLARNPNYRLYRFMFSAAFDVDDLSDWELAKEFLSEA